MEELVFSKELYVPQAPPQKISKIEFAFHSETEIVKGSELCVYETSLYQMPERTPKQGSVLDTRLGISNKSGQCSTCHRGLSECSGHFGHIQLVLPLFHIGFLNYTIKILQIICKTCSRVLLTPPDREEFKRKLRSPKLPLQARKAIFKAIHTKQDHSVSKPFRNFCVRCKSTGNQIKICPFCGGENAVVKKAGGVYKIMHDKYKFKSESEGKSEFEQAIYYNHSIARFISNITDDLNPLRVYHLFRSIPDEDVELLCIGGRPEDLIVTAVPVPPVCIRPSVEMEGVGSNEDDISMKLTQILEYNTRLRIGFEQSIPVTSLVEIWDAMQIELAVVLNSDLPGLSPLLQPQRRIRGYVQRLKGKSGRFRGNLSGKRVDFSGRTVISPDPNLGIDELAIPMHIAKTLTYPERVNQHNIAYLQKCILNGQFVHPGANLVTKLNGAKFFLKFADGRKIARELQPGDIVERHLHDGDVVLFNRQPSLHRVSMMAHKAKIRPWKTLRFNECVCSPYNADFDGDEMNLHLPQTEEAKAEALMLMGTEYNLCTPKSGELLVAATQDFLTCAFLVTSKDVFLTRAQFGMFCCYMVDAQQEIHIPPPTVLKPMELWTGKQLFSVLLRPNSRCRIFVNVEMKEKFYSREGEHLCPNDGYVHFINSEHISGRLGKTVLGGSQGGLLGVVKNDYGGRAAAEVMKRLSKFSARYMGDRGFSIGIDDVTPSRWLNTENLSRISNSYRRCEEYIDQFKQGRLIPEPGMDAEETLEAKVTGELNEIRSEAGKFCMSSLKEHNSCLIMSLCGSKGSPINIAQMIACVGQQTVNGSRTPNGFSNRSLPHFPKGDKTPAAKGFVANSFYSGLSPTEFFFHTMAGREGLVDTAVKTAETGYMSRRLIKALEDLYVHYDTTVRDASTSIVQLKYGDDGLDPPLMECRDGEPIDFVHLMSRVKSLSRSGEIESISDLSEEVQRLIDEYSKTVSLSERFSSDLENYMASQIAEDAEERQRVGVERRRGRYGAISLSRTHLLRFFKTLMKSFASKSIQPGTTVGAIAAQSIGEPGTQMTLKTFHFAGVASMQVTQGVPRIKEIINASKTISTPIIHVALENKFSPLFARIIKSRLESTKLSEISKSITSSVSPYDVSIHIELDLETMAQLQIETSVESIREAILKDPRSKIGGDSIFIDSPTLITIAVPDFGEKGKENDLLSEMHRLEEVLPKVIATGLPSVDRAIIQQKQDESYQIIAEGTDLLEVMSVPGVSGSETVTNHVMETERVLGIEAARARIISEIEATMIAFGMFVDHRHTMLLADCMTYKGEVLGITRTGISKMKDSVLHAASFEKTADHLFDAALHGRVDNVSGVSESIITGIPMPTGTGLFKILYNESSDPLTERGPLLL